MTGSCDVPISGSLAFRWSFGNSLSVYEKKSQNQSTTKLSDGADIFEIQCSAVVGGNEFMHRLFRASYDIFRAVQKCYDKADLMRLSHQYRTALAMCSQEIFDFLESCQSLSIEKMTFLAAEGELAKTYELVWHLSEIVFFQALAPGKLSYSLTSWHYVQSQEAANSARRILDDAGKHQSTTLSAVFDPKVDSEFWPTTLALVLQARSVESAALLATHPSANSAPFRSIRQLLNSMPIPESQTTISETEWKTSGTALDAWDFWQRACFKRLSEVEFEEDRQDKNTDMSYMCLILSILAGKQSAWRDPRVVDACGLLSSWYFRFTSWLFYTQRFADTGSLSSLLRQWRESFPTSKDSEPASPIDEIIGELVESIFNADLISLFNISSERFNNWWLVTHLANFVKRLFPNLFASDKGAANTNSGEGMGAGSDTAMTESSELYAILPDFFLLGYAENLASETSLLSVSLGYLDHCSSFYQMAREIQTKLLCNVKPTSTSLANFLIKEARRRDLHDAADEIARVKVAEFRSKMHDMERNSGKSNACTSSVCSALGWSIVARDGPLVTQLATRVLWSDMPQLHDLVPYRLSEDRSRSIREVATIVSCLFGAGSGGGNACLVGTSGSWLSISPEIAFLVRYAELHQLITDGQIQLAVEILLDLLTAGSMSANSQIDCSGPGRFRRRPGVQSSAKYSPHLPLHFRLHLLIQLKPYIEDFTHLNRDQIEMLTAVVTDLRATIDIASVGRDLEPTALADWFLGMHALLARARAAAVLRGGTRGPLTDAVNFMDAFSDLGSECATTL